MTWLASPLWNLAYLAGTLAILPRAYYSRHEYVQKLALLVVASYIASNIAAGLGMYLEGAYLIDMIGILYAGALCYKSGWREPTTHTIVIISALDIILHGTWGHGGIEHSIAYNLLYVAQLLSLSIYGKRYGRQARRDERQTRNDPYYRFEQMIAHAWAS